MCFYYPLCASVVMRGLVELDAKCGGRRFTRGVALGHNSEVVCSSPLVFPELHLAIRVIQDVCLPTPHGLGTLVGHCRLQSKVYIVQADATNPDNCMYVGGRRGFAPSRLQLTNSASYSRLDDDTGAAGAGGASAGVVAAAGASSDDGAGEDALLYSPEWLSSSGVDVEGMDLAMTAIMQSGHPEVRQQRSGL